MCVWAVLACVSAIAFAPNKTTVAVHAAAAPPAPPDVPLELLQLARADAARVEELEAS